MAKYLDENGLLYFWGKIKAAFVAKETGKGLSTNDYTTTEKNKLNGIATGAQVNVIETVKVNGTALEITSKAVDVPVPTGNNVAPAMDGVADAGSATTFARGDHVHPTDTSRAASDHVHGNITNDGKITAAGVALANNDTLVIVDSSDSSKIKQSSIKFNGSTTTKALTQKGTFETFYQKASGGIPASDLASGVQTSLGKADSAYQLPADGIPATDLESSIQTSLGKADTAYQKPSGGIPGTDLAETYLTQHQSLAAYAPLASPALTGTPTAPTASSGTNTTQIATTAFVKAAVDAAIGSITGIEFRIVESLPASGEAGVIYLVSHSHGTGDIYDEYIWVNNGFEKIGSTDIDLSGYWAKTDLVAITNAEIDTIVAA